MPDDETLTTPFADLDEMPPEVVELLIDALRRMAAHPQIQRVRQAALAALRLAPGQRVLDAGAGAGEVARKLAALVAPGGSVVALDRSAATVAVARERHDGSAVDYRTGDVTALDFRDGEFDGVRCERVLQHLPEPDEAIRELIRVTRAGGRICLVDTDWESVAFDGVPVELVAAMRSHFFARAATHQRDMGRTLRRRLVRAGVHEVEATPFALVFDTPDSAGVVLPFVDPRVPPAAGMIPDELRGEWFAAVDAAGARGEFLATLTLWVAAGTV